MGGVLINTALFCFDGVGFKDEIVLLTFQVQIHFELMMNMVLYVQKSCWDLWESKRAFIFLLDFELGGSVLFVGVERFNAEESRVS